MEGSVIVSGAPESIDEELVQGLPPEEVHRRALEARRALGRTQRSLSFWLMEVERRQLFMHFGCSNVFHYAELHLELAPHTIAELLRTSKELDKLPKFAQAVAEGEVAPTKAREISRVATPETEDYWMEVAKSSTCRQVEKLVSLTPKGGLPPAAKQGVLAEGVRCALPKLTLPTGDAPDRCTGSVSVDISSAVSEAVFEGTESRVDETPVGPSRYRTKLVIELENDEMALIENAFEKARSQTGSRERSELMLHIAKSFLDGEAGGNNSSTPYRITLHTVEGAGLAWVDGAAGPQFVPESTVEEALCDAEILDLRETAPVQEKDGATCDDECCSGGPEGASNAAVRPTGDRERGPRVRKTIPPSLRRKVLERDGYCCTMPGCKNRRYIALHHIASLAEGGADKANNICCLCSKHHRMVHRHQLFVEGKAPDALIWRDAKGKRFRVFR